MPVRHLLVCCAVSALMLPAPAPAPAAAQAGKERFLRGLEEFSNAVAGTYGDEGAALVAAVAGMRAGLEEWDGLIAKIEARFAAEVVGAPPLAAARMRTALGTVYLERGRIADAIAQFEAAAPLDPAFPEVHVLRGLAYTMAERPEDAAAAYRALWQEAGGSPGHAYLFLKSVRNGDASSRAASAREALVTAVEQPRAADGTPLFPRVGALDDVSVTAPLFPPAAYAAAFELLASSRYDEAIARLAEATGSDPLVTDPGLKDPEARDAIAALRDGRASTALGTLGAAASRLGSAALHRIVGIAYAERKQYGESLEQLRRAVHLNPIDDRARVALADVLVDAGEPVAAREVLVETTRVTPTSGAAHWKLGRLAQLMGDEREAIRAFEAAAALAPIAGIAHVHAAIGRLHHNHLDLDAAADAYARRLRHTPNDGSAHADLGDVYRSQGALDAAMTEFLVAALLDPSSARAFASIGQMHAAAGRDEAAVPMLRRATALDASHLEARYALSRALLRLGRTDEASQELDTFRQLQAKAMEEERRRFRENQIKIDETLNASEAVRKER